jgi:pimeloyl-ACP methyl ester carboxylesterase
MIRKWLVTIILVLVIALVAIYYALDPEDKELNQAERERLEGTYVKLSDGVTHYKLSGPADGKLVVLVHGGTVPLWTWDKQIEALIEAGYRVLSYDKFGRGYSDRPGVTYDQALYKKQLLELVNTLGLTQKFDLIGYSLGGATVTNFTAQNPDRVDKLVLISPMINNFKTPSIFKPPVVGELIARFIGIKIVVDRFVTLMEGHPDSVKYKNLFEEQTKYKGFQQSILSMLRNDAMLDYSKAYQVVGKQDREVMLIWGTGDTEISPAMIKDIRSFIPNIQFKPVEGVGHGIVFQKFETVNRLILDFLQ